MGISVLELIEKNWKLYRQNYQKIIVPFVIIGIISFIMVIGIVAAYFLVLGSFMRTPYGSNMGTSEPIELFNTISNMLIPLLILGIIIMVIISILEIMLMFSVYKPIKEIINKKNVSSWKTHFSSQFKNAIKVIIAKILISIPLLLAIISIAFGLFNMNANPAFLLLGLLLGIIFGIISIILAIGTLFVNYNIVLKNEGIISSIKKSLKIVRKNAWTCFSFIIIWGILSAVVSGIASIIPCIGSLIYIPIRIGVITPVYLFSYIMLGEKLVK